MPWSLPANDERAAGKIHLHARIQIAGEDASGRGGAGAGAASQRLAHAALEHAQADMAAADFLAEAHVHAAREARM
jgi:hypothetical protein